MCENGRFSLSGSHMYPIPVATLGKLIILLSPNIKLLAYGVLYFVGLLTSRYLGKEGLLVLGGIPSSKCIPSSQSTRT